MTKDIPTGPTSSQGATEAADALTASHQSTPNGSVVELDKTLGNLGDFDPKQQVFELICDHLLNSGDPELGHDSIRQILISTVHPSPENDTLYRPILATDPEISALAASITVRGIMEPLVITRDGFILSGHRRFVAAKLAGLDSIPCRIRNFDRADDPDQFLVLLREFNRQREKSFDEKLREETVSVNPEIAYQTLISQRKLQAHVGVSCMAIGAVKQRAKISTAKQEFLGAVRNVLDVNSEFWPLSDRQVHYRLLNNPPLRHSKKPDSFYRNDLASYKSLVDLLTRARLNGAIPMRALADETRPIRIWKTWRDVSGYIRAELKELLGGYWRDLVQSQPNHIEILVEKNTVANIVKEVAMG